MKILIIADDNDNSRIKIIIDEVTHKEMSSNLRSNLFNLVGIFHIKRHNFLAKVTLDVLADVH